MTDAPVRRLGRRPSRSGGPREEIVVDLGRPEDLLSADPETLLDDDPAGVARVVPGVEEVLSEILARRWLRKRRRVVLTLPAAALPEDPDDAAALGRRLAGATARWARARGERTVRETRVLWRQGVASLGSGTLLFVIGLVLSTNFLEPDVPDYLQNLLGNGVFLVIAWVGLWYPLDMLFFARAPLRRELRALDSLSRMPVELRPRP